MNVAAKKAPFLAACTAVLILNGFKTFIIERQKLFREFDELLVKTR